MQPLYSHHRRWQAMGTVFETFLNGDDDAHLQAVIDASEDEVRRLESVLSRFDPTSELSRLNRDAFRRPTRVSVEMWELLAACEQARKQTDGLFDITAGSNSTAANNRSLLFDPTSRSIQFSAPTIQVDLGGVGKGFALDRVAAIWREFGVASGLLNAGTSSVLAVGTPLHGGGWPIDVREPSQLDPAPLARIYLANRGFSCSATRHPGQLTSDLHDPSTGEALLGSAACVVLSPTAMTAEILSTAISVLGREGIASHPLWQKWPDVQVAWIEAGTGPAQLQWLTEAP